MSFILNITIPELEFVYIKYHCTRASMSFILNITIPELEFVYIKYHCI